jgi:hypothetical protein
MDQKILVAVVALLVIAFRYRIAALLIAVIPWLDELAKRSVYAKWSGKYFAYDGMHLRFCMDEGVIWVVERDLARIIRPGLSSRELRLLGAERMTIPGHRLVGITSAGVARLLATRTRHRRAERDMVRLNLWLENEVYPNLRRLPSASM